MEEQGKSVFQIFNTFFRWSA